MFKTQFSFYLSELIESLFTYLQVLIIYTKTGCFRHFSPEPDGYKNCAFNTQSLLGKYSLKLNYTFVFNFTLIKVFLQIKGIYIIGVLIDENMLNLFVAKFLM